MNVVEVMVSDCTELDIIARDVVNLRGIIMLAKGTMITDYIKRRLIELQIERVSIYSPVNSPNNSKNSLSYQNCRRQYRETIISIKNIIYDLACGRPLQYDKVACVANSIMRLINEKRNVINCLNEIRDADVYTYNHCVNVAFYSMLIGAWLKLPHKEISHIIQAGLLHDIGKTKIPDKILNKKGRLTNEEFDVIKNHTVLGYKLLYEIDDINCEVKNAVLLHHERADGSGYPFNASSNSMGLYAKIIAIADVFDAMTSDRIYKKKQTPFDAFEMFKSVGLEMFDINILDTFVKNISPYYVGSNVILNNGERGKIVYVPPQNILSPVVEVQSDYLDLSTQDRIKIVSVV